MTREEVWVAFASKAMECKRAQGGKFDHYPLDEVWCADVGTRMLLKFDKQFPREGTQPDDQSCR